ncbi:MAG: hypothetical protein P4L49_03500 [Desulfosporosinus sp.]|nr:hypothetical protein [Desulfosporosinus sp.]
MTQGYDIEGYVAIVSIYQLKPKSIGITSLVLTPGTDLYEQKLKGEFVEATELERVEELKYFVENLETKTKVLANHVSMATLKLHL